MTSSQVSLVPFAPHLLDSFADRRGRQWLTAMKDPNTMFFSELAGSAQRTQHDSIIQAFQLQVVACRKLQYVPYRL
jgi:hypothetical protein